MISRAFDLLADPFADFTGELAGEMVEAGAQTMGEALPVDIPIITIASALHSA